MEDELVRHFDEHGLLAGAGAGECEQYLLQPITKGNDEAVAINLDLGIDLAAAEISEYVRQRGGPCSSLLLDNEKLLENLSNSEVGALLALIAPRMREREVAWRVLASRCERLDMVDVGLLDVHVDISAANVAFCHSASRRGSISELCTLRRSGPPGS